MDCPKHRCKDEDVEPSAARLGRLGLRDANEETQLVYLPARSGHRCGDSVHTAAFEPISSGAGDSKSWHICTCGNGDHAELRSRSYQKPVQRKRGFNSLDGNSQ